LPQGPFLRTEYAEGLFFPRARASAHARTSHTHDHLHDLKKGCNSVSSFGIVKCAHTNYLIGYVFNSCLTYLYDYLPAPPAPPILPTLPTRPTLPIRSTKDQEDDYKNRIQRALKTLNNNNSRVYAALHKSIMLTYAYYNIALSSSILYISLRKMNISAL
jgi:hypothetical protein